ncbi:hypothetical protein YC2023_108767 [Brassica napus]
MTRPYHECFFLIQTLLGRASLSKWVKGNFPKLYLSYHSKTKVTVVNLQNEALLPK